MNRERQLLHAWLSFATRVSIDPMHEKLYKTTKEFLDKPEQEPVAWILKEKETGYKTQVAYRPSVLKKGWEAIALYPEKSSEGEN